MGWGIIKDFEYEHQNETYLIKIEHNDFYPNQESMYKIYLGLQNKTEIIAYDDTFFTIEKLKKYVKNIIDSKTYSINIICYCKYCRFK
jgi:hypothetical protein